MNAATAEDFFAKFSQSTNLNADGSNKDNN